MESEPASRPMIRSRRAAREAALRALYQSDVAAVAPGEAVEHVLCEVSLHPDSQVLVRQLTIGVETELGPLDDLIRPYLASGWTLERLAVIDRCLLRMAAYELWHLPAIPPKVTAHELVILAKKYGDESSYKFVNGVIGQLIAHSPKSNWDPSETDEIEPEAASDADSASLPDVLPAVEEEEVEEGSDAMSSLAKIGVWTLRREGDLP